MTRVLRQKSDPPLVVEQRERHDRIWVQIDGRVVGPVLVSRGSGEMNGREIGNCARSLGLKEPQFRQLVGCTFTREDFAAVSAPRA